MQDRSNSSVLAMELLQSCIKPSLWSVIDQHSLHWWPNAVTIIRLSFSIAHITSSSYFFSAEFFSADDIITMAADIVRNLSVHWGLNFPGFIVLMATLHPCSCEWVSFAPQQHEWSYTFAPSHGQHSYKSTAAAGLRSTTAEQAETVPHHTSTVWLRYLTRDRGKSTKPCSWLSGKLLALSN